MLDEGKIAKAVEAALRFIGSESDKHVRFVEYLAMLEADSNWSAAEISVVQARVSRELHAQPS
jgi:hypothetical protein